MKDIITQLSKNFEIKETLLAEIKSEEALLNLLSSYVQELINKDFDHLLYLLYKIDVGEKKVKAAILKTDPENANIVIAKMILEREKQKIKSRKKYKTNDNTEWIF